MCRQGSLFDVLADASGYDDEADTLELAARELTDDAEDCRRRANRARALASALRTYAGDAQAVRLAYAFTEHSWAGTADDLVTAIRGTGGHGTELGCGAATSPTTASRP